MKIVEVSAINDLIAAFFITSVYTYLFLIKKSEYMKLWMISWMLYSLNYLFEVIGYIYDLNSFIVISNCLEVISAYLLISGAIKYFKLSLCKYSFGLTLLIVFIHIIDSIFNNEYIISNYFVGSYIGIIYVMHGLVLFVFNKNKRIDYRLLGVVFCFWGINRFCNPFFIENNVLIPSNFVLVKIFCISAAILTLIIYFNDTKNELMNMSEKWELAMEDNGDIFIDSDYKNQIFNYNSLNQKKDFAIPKKISEWESVMGEKSYKVFKDIIYDCYKRKDDKFALEHDLVDNMGKQKWVLHRGKIIKWLDNKQEPERIISVLTDITCIKINQLELVKARKEAEIANNVRRNFITNISHELKTPVNGIYGMVQLMEMNNTNLDFRENIVILKESTKKIDFMINNIIYYTNIESGNFSTDEVNFNINNLVNSITKDYVQYLKRKKIELKIDIDSRLPDELIGDKDKITMLIKQLFDNAVKFTRRGSIGFSIKLINDNIDEMKISIEIEDTGIGIDKSKSSRLYEYFTQEDSTFTKEFSGIGLGLAISKKICDVIKAEINYNSMVNEGTRFCINLNLKVNDRLNNDDVKLSKDTILIVDDDDVSRKLLRLICNEKGYKTDFANDGKSAISLYKKNKYKLILLDIQMPEISGIDTLNIMKKIDTGKNINTKYIAVTAYALKGDKEKFISTGFDSYISKPVNSEEVIQLIEKYI